MTGEIFADRYELLELVGTGGMSSVYCARDQLLERRVALKLMHQQYTGDEEYVERFRREARAVAQLSHPHIVTVIDRGEADGRQYIVFEYVDGQNLKQFVEATGPLPVPDALELTLEIAGALLFAHRNGLVHRDVKPQNVLLNGDGKAKVTDFGIARSLDVDGVTQTGTVLGTSNYIAPEQASGRPVGPETDVYSLGIVLYELLTAELPFVGDNFVSVAMQHVNDPPPSVLQRRPDTPARVAHTIERALEKDPARRVSMEELIGELEACLAGAGGPAAAMTTVAPVPVRRPGPRPRQRVGSGALWPYVAGAVVLAIVLATIGAFALRGGGSQSDGASSPPARSRPVHLAGSGSYDPFSNDKSEHDAEVGSATDGDMSTYWTTSSYHYGGGSLNKPGVGLVLDAGRSVRVERIRIRTDTPGFVARIRAGDAQGSYRFVSPPRTIGPATTIALPGSVTARYFVIWITRLGVSSSTAHVNEVAAR